MVSCVFGYFENLLSVQEETRRNEGKKKNKQKNWGKFKFLEFKNRAWKNQHFSLKTCMP